jgi:hypothetical protein
LEGEVRRIEIVLAGNPDQREQGIAAGVCEGCAYPKGEQLYRRSEDTRSPEAWTSVILVVSFAASMQFAMMRSAKWDREDELSFSQPDAGSPAVFCDELNSGFFQSSEHCV